MAVYYKFKSAKDYDSIPIDGHFISVGNLKEKIFESKQLGRGTDFDLLVTNAQTNEEYLDESMLIPKNTSVLIRRVPGRPRMPIVTAPVPEPDEPMVENESEDVQTVKSGFVGVDSSAMKYPDDSEWDEFGNDLYAIPETLPAQSSNPFQDAPPPSKIDEDSKIKALIETPALDWQRQSADGFGPGRGFGRGMGGRMMGGRGFGRGGLERKTPPQGYVCHRCKVPGHFIQHCPTNGDPNYDIKRVKPPTGIPKSMLVATPDGSYALPTGAVAVLKPNEAAFEKEIEGLPSTRPVGDLPPELHCPLCKEVMKDAVLTSKCCFKSFCDKCIRDYIISKSVCVCGATNILADDLLPNKTLRDTINRILESNNSSAENGGSAFQVQDMESRNPQAKVPSPTQSVASRGEQVAAPAAQKEETPRVLEVAEERNAVIAPHQTSEKVRAPKGADASEATHESVTVKEPASQGSAPLPDEEVQQRPVSGEAVKKKKKKKARLPLNAADMQWRAAPDLAAENYMGPMAPAYNPYWTGIQPGMEGFMGPYTGGAPYMGFGLGPFDMPFGGVIPQDPFAGQACMLPFGPPQRDLADFGMGFNNGAPIMSREEFEARKANLKRKREIERRGESQPLLKDRDFGREVIRSGDISMKSKSKAIPPPSSSDQQHPRHRSERPSPNRRSRDPEFPHPSSKRKAEYDHDYDDHKSHRDYRDDYHQDDHHHHRDYIDDDRRHREHHQRSSHQRSGSTSRPTPEPAAAAPKSTSAADKKQKLSVFSRISFPPEDQGPKKRKPSSSAAEGPVIVSLLPVKYILTCNFDAIFLQAFPVDSPLVVHFSRAIRKVIAADMTGNEQKKFWPRYSSELEGDSVTEQSPSLTAYNFGGLFIIIGSALVFAVCCSETSVGRKFIAMVTYCSHKCFTCLSPCDNELGTNSTVHPDFSKESSNERQIQLSEQSNSNNSSRESIEHQSGESNSNVSAEYGEVDESDPSNENAEIQQAEPGNSDFPN